MREQLDYSNTQFYDFTNKDLATILNIDNMLNKTVTMFKYRKLPETLPERELELILQIKGYGIVTEHNDDLVALWGGFAPPHDIYYRPTKCLVNNPWANINKEYTFGDDCILVRNDPMNRGLLPILRKWCSMQTEAELTESIALQNLRALFAITATNDAEYKSALKFLEDVKAGKNGVMMSDDFKSGIGVNPLLGSSNNGYLTQIIEMLQYIKGSMYQEIGLQSTFNMKRERLSEAESGMDTDCLRPLVDSMLEERQTALEKINKKYGTEITVEFNSSWNKYNQEEEHQEQKQETPEEQKETNDDDESKESISETND